MNNVVLKRCIGCGNEFKVDPRMKKNRKYCSAECYRKYCNYIKMSSKKKEKVVKKQNMFMKIINYFF